MLASMHCRGGRESTAVNDDDPSIGIATDGTVYMGWKGSNGHPYIALSQGTP